MNFKGFTETTFAAFEPKKWSSNIYNVERMTINEQMRALGMLLEPALTTRYRLGWDVSSHVPNIFNNKRVNDMTLYFTRTETQRKAIAPLLDSRIPLQEQIHDSAEHHRHVTLGVRLDQKGLELGLLLHSNAWLDVMNLLNRCRMPLEAENFVRLVNGQPEGTVVRIGPDKLVKAQDFSVQDIERLEHAVLNEVFLIFIGQQFEPNDTRIQGPQFVGIARTALEQLLPLWDFIAWRPASDYLEPAADRHTERDISVDISSGTPVRIVEGVFAGREGIVLEIDSRGHVRVLVGRVNIRTDIKAIRAIGP